MRARLLPDGGEQGDIPPVPLPCPASKRDHESLQKANIVWLHAFIILWFKMCAERSTVNRFKGLSSELKAVATGIFRRRRTPITDAGSLANFIDEQSAFLIQKGIYEYSRARAGHYAKVLFAEPEFQGSVEAARWRAYPIGLAMVAELVEGVLRPLAVGTEARQLDGLSRLVLSIFDRYPTPSALQQRVWDDARAELARRLQLVGLHPPKRAFEIPEPFARAYFDLMPIHKSLRASEFPTLHNYLKVTLCNVHEELTKRMDGPALVAALLEGPDGQQAAHEA